MIATASASNSQQRGERSEDLEIAAAAGPHGGQLLALPGASPAPTAPPIR